MVFSDDSCNKGCKLTGNEFSISANEHKKVIYTCITGKYDTVIQHEYTSPEWDYVCFTDNPDLLKHKNIGVWQIRKAKKKNFNRTKNARWHKTHPHVLLPEYDESVWIDANINIKTNKLFDVLNEKSKNAVLLVPAHYKRNCIYQECEAVLDSQNDTLTNVNKTKNFLIKQGMPPDFGMNETNIIYRKHKSKHVISLMEEWYRYIKKYSKRDQLSWTFVLWKNGIDINKITIPNARIDKDNYDIINHKNKKFCNKKYKVSLLPILKIFFEVKNDDTRKVITILGIKMKFKSRKLIERKKFQDMENKIKKLSKKIKKLQNSQTENNIQIMNIHTEEINQIKNLIEEKNIKTNDIINTLSNKINSYKRESDKTFKNIHEWQCYLHNNQDISHQNINVKFSVIMPTYNRAFCIEKAINSLINQTYSNWELIIIDDGSTDDTEFIIRNKYGKYLEEEKIIYKKIEHAGQIKARNVGLELAKNPWLAYLDTDNEIFSTFLESFAEAITNYPGNKCFYARLICSDSEIKGRKFDFESLCEKNYIDIGVFVHHKSLIDEFGGFDETIDCLEDWDIIVRYTRNNTPIFIDKILLNYNTGVDYERITTCTDMSNTRSIIKNRMQEQNNNVVFK